MNSITGKLLTGHWYPNLGSRQQRAELRITATNYQLHTGDQIQSEGSPHKLSFSDRTGNIPRKITFPDGSLFETRDNDAVDSLLGDINHKAQRSGIIHRLESSWKWVIAGVLLIAGVTFNFFKWGLPSAANHIAHALPVSIHESVAVGSMKFLDRVVFEETELSIDAQREISDRFESYLDQMDTDEFHFRLYFRQMSGLPNAMALPSGEIIVTDALVALVENTEELDAILFHEIGHVLQRHSMQHVIQASAISLILSLAIGDVTGAGELVVGTSTFLLQNSYSRKSESEADDFAFRTMTSFGIDPKYFAAVILKFEEFDNESGESVVETDDARKAESYLSSHPLSPERARRAAEYSDTHFNSPFPDPLPEK